MEVKLWATSDAGSDKPTVFENNHLFDIGLRWTAMQADKTKRLKIILAFAAVYIIWGTTYLAIRVAVETVPAFFMAGARFVAAGVLMVLFLRLRGVPSPKRSHWREAIVVGALLLAGGSGLLHWSEQTIPSGIAALVIATVPLWIALFDWLVFRGGRPGKKIVAGLLLGLAGIMLLIGPGQFTETPAFSWTALAILLLSPILWSFGSLYSRQAGLAPNIFMASGMEMIAGGIILLIAGLLTGEGSRLDLAAIAPLAWLSFLYLLFFGSIIAFTSYIWLLQTVNASKVATYSYVNPIIAVFLGSLILSEPITPTTIAAMAVIVVAVFLITTSRSAQAVPEVDQPRPPSIDSPETAVDHDS